MKRTTACITQEGIEGNVHDVDAENVFDIFEKFPTTECFKASKSAVSKVHSSVKRGSKITLCMRHRTAEQLSFLYI